VACTIVAEENANGGLSAVPIAAVALLVCRCVPVLPDACFQHRAKITHVCLLMRLYLLCWVQECQAGLHLPISMRMAAGMRTPQQLCLQPPVMPPHGPTDTHRWTSGPCE